MTPTPQLRFVEREIPRRYPNDPSTMVIRVLQQKWEGGMREETEGFFRKETEWRDVECVKEEACT